MVCEIPDADYNYDTPVKSVIEYCNFAEKGGGW